MDGTSVTELEFKDIYDAYQPRILRYLVRLVGEPEAEDLAQEVFMKASRALESFKGESELSTWLYRIATNSAIDRMRTASFRRGAAVAWPDDSDEADSLPVLAGEDEPSLEQQLMRKEMGECFVDYVKRLPPTYRPVVVLSELEGLTNKEIAGILGLSVDAVKIRLHRGREKLFGELRTHCTAEDWL